MNVIIESIGFMGIGALLLALVQHILHRRDKSLERKANEKKDAYTGLINAIFTLQDDETLTESDVALRYWVARVQLVCSPDIFEWLFELEGSRTKALSTKMKVEAMISAMRQDLGIA